MEICSRFTGMERKNGAFLLHTDNADVKVCFVTDEIVRVRASFDHELAEEPYVLMTTAWEDRIKPLPDAALYRSTRIHHTPDSYTKRELVGAGPLHLAYARPFGRLKAPLGLSLLRCAAQTRACLWQAEQAHHANNEKQEVPTCWVSVKQFSKNDTATACQDWLRSTRLGRGSIKSHVRTVKVLGMGLFAFQERIPLWKGVTH